ncbi:uncharacterized protein YbaP (TraB family) [Paraburkholderia unamae]|nr:uncharacterized protein YbaP (TraB family) [Paraburkholderia unamae]
MCGTAHCVRSHWRTMSRSFDSPERRAMRPVDDVRHRSFGWLKGLLLAAAALAVCASTPALAQTSANVGMIWTATLPGHPTLLLLPTIHNLAHEDPRIDATLASLAGSVRAIALEAPMALNAQRVAMIRQDAALPPDDNLTNHMKTMSPAALAQCARDSHFDIVKFLQLKPWVAAAAIDAWRTNTVPGGRRDAGAPTAQRPGIDTRLETIALKQHIPLIYLAGFDAELHLLDGIPARAQEALLVSSCAAFHGTPPGSVSSEVLERAWIDADGSVFERISTQQAPGESDAHFEATRYVMLEGTRIFAATLARDDYFHGKGAILVAVGASHYFGEESLIDRLRRAGYTVTPPQHSAIVSSR